MELRIRGRVGWDNGNVKRMAKVRCYSVTKKLKIIEAWGTAIMAQLKLNFDLGGSLSKK
jgi:hypothetical protein